MIASRPLTSSLAALAVAVALGACSREETTTSTTTVAPAPAAPQETVVKIGHAAPLTGGIAHLGKDNEYGARLAIEQANGRGLTIGGQKVKFELLAEDDEEKPDRGPIIAQKFADAKVAGVVGHLNSGVTIPASNVYNKAGIPMISGSATNPQLTEQGFKNVFRVVGRDDQQGPAIASFLMSQHKPKTVAIIDDATAYGEGLANEVEKALKAAGAQVLPREKGTKDHRDWKAVLTKLRGRSPDAIFYGGMDATGGPLLKQGRELGIKGVFAFGDGACTDKMKELAGDKQAEGLVCSQAGIPVQAASKAFTDAYKAKFNQDPILYSPFTYDATNLLIAAMQKADSTDPAKYLPALAGIEYKGASGVIRFDEKGDRKDAEMTIFTMTGGKLEPVAIVKSGQTVAFADFMKTQGGETKAADGGAAAPAGAPAPDAAQGGEPMKPAEPAKDAQSK
jgi:branched-chain amino acid transport system substrate-binding protein